MAINIIQRFKSPTLLLFFAEVLVLSRASSSRHNAAAAGEGNGNPRPVIAIGSTLFKTSDTKWTNQNVTVTYSHQLSALYAGIPLMDRTVLTKNLTLMKQIISPNWNKSFYATLEASSLTKLAFTNAAVIDNTTPTLNKYKKIYDYFMDHYGDALTANEKPRGLWSRDIKTDPRLSEDDRWNDDDVFAQTRLMGVNPVQIERVTSGGFTGIRWSSLRLQLNSSFDWNEAVQNELGVKYSIKKAISRGRLLVVRYPLLAKVTADRRATGAFSGQRLLSPIALFITTHRNSSPIKPIAIQLGHTASSPIYTPRSGYFWWTAAKMYVNNADGLVSQVVHHLVNAHLVSEVFAIAALRHLDNNHPINNLLKPHFEGLVGINTAGFEMLTNENGSITKLAGLGHSGMQKLIKLAYQKWRFTDMDFVADLKRRGLWKSRRLSYYPYRDDGKLLYEQLENYVKDYVDNYYSRDSDVQRDSQLHSWSSEISHKHKNSGFPSVISRKIQLYKILINIIWVNTIHHAILNYPVKEFGSYIPFISYTLFKKPSDWHPSEIVNITRENNDGLTKMLPPVPMAVEQATVTSQLASLRYKDLFSHSSSMTDPFAKELAAGYYEKLVGIGGKEKSVQETLEERNIRRHRLGLLPYRNMLPAFLPNSIAI